MIQRLQKGPRLTGFSLIIVVVAVFVVAVAVAVVVVVVIVLADVVDL